MGNLYCGLCKASSGRGGILWPHDGTHGDSFFLSFFLSFFFGARARGSHACCLRSFVPLPSFSPCFAFLRRVFLFPSNVISNNTNYLGFVGFVVASFSFSFFQGNFFQSLNRFSLFLSLSRIRGRRIWYTSRVGIRGMRERERESWKDRYSSIPRVSRERALIPLDR